MKQVNPPKTEFIACFADQQTAGKGQHGRPWLSPKGHNIYHSLLCPFQNNTQKLTGLSLAVGVFVARALKNLGITKDLALKWPNDILWHQEKLGGVLIEIASHNNTNCTAIIGIGINTRLTTQTKLNRPVTSTEQILKKETDRNTLAAHLLNELIPGLIEFQKNGLKPFLNEWKSFDAFLGKKVKLKTPQQEIIGIMKGISENGELLLEDKQGQLSTHLNGEASLYKQNY